MDLDPPRMKRLYTAGNLPEAYLLLHTLKAAGIEARVFNENAQGGVGELPFTHTYPELWVEDAEYARARTVVEQFEQPGESSAWLRCSRCGEQNPDSFDFCWHCSESLT